MRVTFVALGAEQMGISLLSAVLRRAGHETSLVFNPALFHDRYYLEVPWLGAMLDRTDLMIEELCALRPDVVAFSVLTPIYTWSLEVARAVKQRLGVPVVFGGVHPSAVPEICLENDCVDYACVGEGEEAFVRLLDAIGGGAHRPAEPIPNMWWKDARGEIVRGPPAPFIQDLDALPHFDKELWADDIRIADNWLTMTARGCPYRCTFCFNNFYAKLPGRGGGKYVRQRSIEHCMEELTEAKSRWKIRRVDFEDDIFTVDKQWIRAFLGEYKREIDVPFQCLVHPRYVDAEVARWLRDAGCQHVQMGVQSADEEYKRKQLLRMEKDAHLQSSLAALAEAGLTANLDHMFGLPDEPLSAQERAREIYAEYPPRVVQTFWLTHLPGIELTKDAVARGHLTEDDYEAIQRGDTRLFHSRGRADADGSISLYRRYEILFKALPLLPAPLRARARIDHVPRLGGAVSHLVGSLLDGLCRVKAGDAEIVNYGRYYLSSLRRLVPELLDRRPRARRVLPPEPRPAARRSPLAVPRTSLTVLAGG